MGVSKGSGKLPILIVSALILLSIAAGATAKDTVQSPNQQPAGPCSVPIAVVNAALSACTELNPNYVCYGTTQTNAEPGDVRFYQPEDRLPIQSVTSVKTALRPAGAALMNLQLAGQSAPVTAILFGDGAFSNAGPGAYFLQINNEQLLCSATPSGLTVRTQEGEQARIKINNVDILLGSIAFITGRGDDVMTVVNLKGHVTVSSEALGVSRELPVGQQVSITEVNGEPVSFSASVPSPYAASSLLQYISSSNGLARVFDPNQQPAPIPACGGDIAIGEVYASTNYTPGEECLFKFCANAGDMITINMDRVGGQLDPYVDLRAPDESLIMWNDNTSATNHNSLICNQVLPVTSCDYTIVARPRANDSKGSFALTLQGATDCMAPLPECNVTSAANLRQGPGTEYPRVATLSQDTELHLLGWNEDYSWTAAEVVMTGAQGWVSSDRAYCSPAGPVATVTPTLTPEPVPTWTPQPGPGPQPPPKLSPYGEP